MQPNPPRAAGDVDRTSTPLVDPGGEDANAAGPSELLLVPDNAHAFALRVLTAREAKSTLDLMYYIWRDDHCGRLLMREVIAAADRGVAVRLLIDDINPQECDANYHRVDDHPNIEVRLFNPSVTRQRGMARVLEMALRISAMTRRMHCKAWIADGAIAIAGGRNVGNEYFDAAETNFRDVDLLMKGAVVKQAGEVFETYWRHEVSKPVASLNSARPLRRRKWATGQSKLETEETLGPYKSVSDYVTSNGPMLTVDDARMLADPPDKALGQSRGNWVMKEVRALISAGQDRVQIVSPYFIPGQAGVEILSDLVKRGVDAAVVTNSLAATDVAAVHGGYANYRRQLLRNGVRLFEFKRSAEPRISVFGSKGASLHTKAFLVDASHGFVGSLNFDPRSASLNMEMGVLFNDEKMVSRLEDVFVRDMAPDTSYRLDLEKGRIVWKTEDRGQPQRWITEPGASLRRRLVALLARWLPVESQL